METNQIYKEQKIDIKTGCYSFCTFIDCSFTALADIELYNCKIIKSSIEAKEVKLSHCSIEAKEVKLSHCSIELSAIISTKITAERSEIYRSYLFCPEECCTLFEIEILQCRLNNIPINSIIKNSYDLNYQVWQANKDFIHFDSQAFKVTDLDILDFYTSQYYSPYLKLYNAL